VKLKQIVRTKLLEAVGVPSGINITAEKIFNDIVDILEEISDQLNDLDDLNGTTLKLKGPYTFSDHTIENIRVPIEIEEDDNLEIMGMYIRPKTEIMPPKIKSTRDDTLTLGLRFQGPYDMELSGLIEFMKSKKPQMVGSIAHEIMHDYDYSKTPVKDLGDQVGYIASQEGVSNIFELNLVIVGGYYLHQIENMVRPSEVYTELMQLGVTKKQFLNRLNEASYMKYLNLMRKLSYEKLISELENNYDKVVEILRDNNLPVYVGDKDRTIQFFLYSIRIFLINKHIKIANSAVSNSLTQTLQLLFNIEDEALKFFREYVSKVSKNGEYLETNFDYEKSSKNNQEYFTDRINKIANTGEKIYRKIAKIYSILPDDDNTQTLNKKISMKGNRNEEVFETTSWDNPKILFGKKYPSDLRNGIGESFDLTKQISLLESRIIDEKTEEGKSFIISEMKKIGIEKLPYAYSALKSFIDSKTMDIHYNKHYKGYVDKLNKALSKKDYGDVELDKIIKTISKYPKEIRNNAGGAFNHALFWKMLSPKKMELKGDLKDKIIKDFGSVAKFKTKFEEEAKSRFGSGWVWLVVTKSNRLKIISTPNQDNPLMNVIEGGGFPILGLDLWEHAYYLKYQNKRDEYISNFWNVVNWEFVSGLFDMKVKTDLL
jgi:Fe-Mn family superoxide dismutase